MLRITTIQKNISKTVNIKSYKSGRDCKASQLDVTKIGIRDPLTEVLVESSNLRRYIVSMPFQISDNLHIRTDILTSECKKEIFTSHAIPTDNVEPYKDC